MPTISIFYGIVIMMHPRKKKHNPPHIHAKYGDYNAKFDITTGKKTDGRFPKRAEQMVTEFILLYQLELLNMWENNSFQKLKGLD